MFEKIRLRCPIKDNKGQPTHDGAKQMKDSVIAANETEKRDQHESHYGECKRKKIENAKGAARSAMMRVSYHPSKTGICTIQH